MTGMTLAKATKEDFKTMWKVSKLMQGYGYEFYPDDDSRRAVRMKNLLMARIDQLGTGGFMRIVMGCEMLIAECCDPAAGHYALKPVLGAGPELLEALRETAADLLQIHTEQYGDCKEGCPTHAALDKANKAITNATGSPT